MDWIAGLAELVGKWRVGHLDWRGYVSHLLSGALWTYIAFEKETYGLLVITVPATYLNCKFLYQWWRKSHEGTKEVETEKD